MVKLNKKGKKFFGFVKKKAGEAGAAIKKYQAEAPQRRQREITKLNQEITLEKKKATLRRLRNKGKPKQSNYNPFEIKGAF